MNWKRAAFVTSMGVTLLFAPPPAGAQCGGDLNGDNEVMVDELITAVYNALTGCELPVSGGLGQI